jgi:peptide/nickel transport system permease protein
MGGLIALALLAMALLAPVIAPYEPRQIIREAHNRVPVYVPPGSAYLLGTDHVGRDILSRIIHGARISLYVGVGAVLIGVTGWFVVGMASAYAGGVVDLVVQRLVDVMMAVPGLIIVLAIMAVLGSSLNNVIIAIVIGMLAPVVRTVRSQVLSVKEMEYIVAARAIGASAAHIIGRHIMPNCLAIYLILATHAATPEARAPRAGVPGCPQLGRHADGSRARAYHPGAVGRYLPRPGHLPRRAGV